MKATVESMLPGGPFYLTERAGWWTRLRVGVRAIRKLAEHPDDCFAAPALHLSMDREPWERVARELMRTPAGRSLLIEKPDLQASKIDLSALGKLPENTLGYALAHYYADNGIAPFEAPYPVKSDVEYLVKRYREIHDVVHLVTGYMTDATGEVELQAFLLGNIGLRQCVLAIIFTTLFPQPGMPAHLILFPRLLAAYRRGKQSGDVAVKPRYEQMWSLALDEVRQKIGLAPSIAAKLV
jgi:ubiquinone biosynthesis protein COQ4